MHLHVRKRQKKNKKKTLSDFNHLESYWKIQLNKNAEPSIFVPVMCFSSAVPSFCFDLMEMMGCRLQGQYVYKRSGGLSECVRASTSACVSRLPPAPVLAAEMLHSANKRHRVAAWRNGDKNLLLTQSLM